MGAALAEQLSGQFGYAPVQFHRGTYRSQLANAQLEPEFQKGTEGGLELFYGTRVNVQITHYDQVDR